MDKQTQFHEENRTFVVSKFVKLSEELLTGLCNLFTCCFRQKQYLRNSEFIFDPVNIILFDFKKN